MRPDTREQLVEHCAQRIDVGCGRHRLALHLLRAGVIRRHQVGPGGRERFGARRFGIQQLGDAEIEQFRYAIGVHQDVAGFEIAVNDQLLVGVLDGVGHLPEQFQALAYRQLVRVGEGDQRLAVDALHDDVRRTVLSGAAIEQTGDVGMFERGQNPALLQEAPPLPFRPRAHP